ncbi:Mu transposase C-terminal domain-containing protein [Azospirillum sp. sgz302134]
MPDVSYRPGSILYLGPEQVRVAKPIDFYTVLVTRVGDGSVLVAKTTDLTTRPPTDAGPTQVALESLTPEQIAEADRRVAMLTPLLSHGRAPGAVQAEVAASLGVSRSTVYRMRRRYLENPRRSALVRGKPDGGRGKSRLSPEQDALLNEVIEKHYLKTSKPRVTGTYKALKDLCRTAKIEPPSYGTLRNRILALDPKTRLIGREGRRRARQLLAPRLKHFPGADFPLAVVQIDHTLMDVFLVDSIYREPIGRPWLTIAIDVYSRMVTGFYVSFEHAGSMSVGMCIYRSIVEKETWLRELGVPGEWPMRGKPAKLLMDNAKEFRGHMVKEACREFGIDPHFRPVKRPSYGGTIERLMGTIANETHLLVGTTKEDAVKLGAYDPQKHARFTLRELEAWLADWIVNDYHKRHHSGLGCSPLKQAHEGFFGDNGIGIPDDAEDKCRLKLALMPVDTRKILDYGIRIDYVNWWSPALHQYYDPEAKRRKDRMIRYDPRDMRTIWVWLDELNDYLAVGYANPDFPPMTRWDLKRAIRHAKDVAESERAITEREIAEAHRRLQEREQEAIAKTKSVRRSKRFKLQAEKRRHHVEEATRHLPHRPPAPPKPIEPLPSAADDDTLAPFDDQHIRIDGLRSPPSRSG